MKTLLTISLFLLSIIVFSQDSTQVDLESVVINSNRIQVGFDQESANVIIVSNADIKKAPVINIVDVLRYYAGVDIRQRGVNGVQSDVGIRGSTFDQVLILINGIKMSDPQSGHHAMNLPIDISNIERVEIIKGPAARIYGQNAFAGAINFITKTPENSSINAQITLGDFGLFSGKLGGSFKTERTSHYLSVSHDQSNGYKYNTDYTLTNLFYQSQIEAGTGSLKILAGYSGREFGANGFYGGSTNQQEAVETGLGSIQYELKKNNFSVQPRLYWRYNHDNYVYDASSPTSSHSIHTGNTVGVELNSFINSKAGVTGIGLDLNRVELVSNNLGNHQRSVATLFAEHRFFLPNRKVDLTPGFQLNYYSDFGINIFPGLDAGFELTSKLKIFGNAGYTYRVPTYTNLYYKDPANFSNPNLEPENALSFELGIKSMAKKSFTGQISYFSRVGNNVIDYTKQLQTDPWYPSNISNIHIEGLDMNASLFVSKMGNPNSLLQQLDLNYTYITNSDISIEANYSKYALDNLIHQFSGNVHLRYSRNLQHSFYYRYSDRVNLPDYSVVDSRISFTSNVWNVFVDVSNIFDVSYRETNLVVMPGRWYKAGLAYKFNFRN